MQILTHHRQIRLHGNAHRLQMGFGPNARQQQKMGRANGTGRKNNLLPRHNGNKRAVRIPIQDTRRPIT